MSCCFFFFKQKTAYEMRISDWSSVVCSSDLCPGDRLLLTAEIPLTDETLCFDCRGVVVWVAHARKELAGTFLGLDYRIERNIRPGLFPGGSKAGGSLNAPPPASSAPFAEAPGAVYLPPRRRATPPTSSP